MMSGRMITIERFREAPWFPWSGWYWSVEGGGSGIAKTKAKAKAAAERSYAPRAAGGAR